MTLVTLLGKDLHVARTAAKVPPDLPARFEELRKLAGLTQDAVADRAGIHRVQVVNIEGGGNKLTSDRMITAMARAFKVTEQEFRAFRDGGLRAAELLARAKGDVAKDDPLPPSAEPPSTQATPRVVELDTARERQWLAGWLQAKGVPAEQAFRVALTMAWTFPPSASPDEIGESALAEIRKEAAHAKGKAVGDRPRYRRTPSGTLIQSQSPPPKKKPGQ